MTAVAHVALEGLVPGARPSQTVCDERVRAGECWVPSRNEYLG